MLFKFDFFNNPKKKIPIDDTVPPECKKACSNCGIDDFPASAKFCGKILFIHIWLSCVLCFVFGFFFQKMLTLFLLGECGGRVTVVDSRPSLPMSSEIGDV